MFQKLFFILLLLLSTSLSWAQNSDLYSAYTLLISDLKGKKIIKKDIENLLEGHPALNFEFMTFEEEPIEKENDIIWITTMNELPGAEPIDDEYIEFFSHGFTEQDIKNVKSPQAGILIQAFYNYDNWQLTDFELSKLLPNLAELYNATIVDEETREFFNPTAFKTQRVDSWLAGLPDIKNQITAHFYQENETHCRYITLGMAKYGLPDIVFNNLPCTADERVNSLAFLIAQTLIERNSTLVPSTFEIDIDLLKHANAKAFFIENLQDNALKACTIKWTLAEAMEGDPDNMLIDISSATDVEGKDLNNPIQILDAVFGNTIQISMASEIDEELEAASQKAIAQIPEIKEQFNNGLPELQHLLIKAAFKSTDEVNLEYMWVEVLKWENGVITGILMNEPRFESTFKHGDKVALTEKVFYDFMIRKGDEIIIESQTNKILEGRD